MFFQDAHPPLYSTLGWWPCDVSPWIQRMLTNALRVLPPFDVRWSPLPNPVCKAYVNKKTQSTNHHFWEKGTVPAFHLGNGFKFQIFVIFNPIWGRFPVWLVETTNQSCTKRTCCDECCPLISDLNLTRPRERSGASCLTALPLRDLYGCSMTGTGVRGIFGRRWNRNLSPNHDGKRKRNQQKF